MPIHNRELPTGSGPHSATLHLWVDVVDGADVSRDAIATLSDDERARAHRYHFERDRARFVARRVFLREVLAQYTGIAPGEIRFRTSNHGRPVIDPQHDLDFNASHSDGLAVVVVARGQRVGVDVERLRPIDDALAIADASFARAEADIVRSAAEPDRGRAFLSLWTRKESYVKAYGVGLTLPLDGFDVSSIDGGGRVRPVGPAGDPRFSIVPVDGLDGYVGAVAVSDIGVEGTRGSGAASAT